MPNFVVLGCLEVGEKFSVGWVDEEVVEDKEADKYCAYPNRCRSFEASLSIFNKVVNYDSVARTSSGSVRFSPN